jgi:hypothetical protein
MAESEKPNILRSINELKNQDPFSPFSIVVSSGDRYLIEAPATLVEMKSEFFYAFPGGERFVLIRINQIVAVEKHGPTKRVSRRKVS